MGVRLAESRANVTAGRVEWNPTVYHDLHEAMDLLYMSPGPDPTNVAVNPITMAEWMAFAGHNLTQLAAAGWKGVFTYDYADMWYPGYNHGYSFMHNSNGRFYELQGATRATPLLVSPARAACACVVQSPALHGTVLVASDRCGEPGRRRHQATT